MKAINLKKILSILTILVILILLPTPIIHESIRAVEFRFKWDEAAQWFGIEQVVY